MNKHLNKIFFLFLVLIIGISSCKKSGTLITATNGTQPGLTASAATLSYTEADSANTAITFTYTPSDFGYSAAVNYDIQFSYNDSNFSKITDQSLTGNSVSYTVKDFNTILLGSKYSAGVQDTVYVRVKSQVATSTLIQYSDTLGIVVTPYMAKRVITYPFLYVPGGYQGWDFAHDDGSQPAIIAKLYSPQSNSTYSGYVNITDTSTASQGAQFKLAPAYSWNYTFGEVTATTFSSSGGNFTLSKTQGPGYYLLTADTTAKTWSISLRNWGIVGDAANGWTPSTDNINFDFDNTDQVLVKTLYLKAGGIKFLANADPNFTVQYGSDGSAINAITGDVGLSSNSSSGNINITEAGTYKITLDLRVPGEPVCTIIQQ